MDGVDPLESATGLGQIGEHLKWCHLGEEVGLVLERAEPLRVDEFEEVGIGAALNGALARLAPCDCHTVLFLGMANGVVGFEIEFVFCARCDLAVVRSTRQDVNLVVGVLEDGAK